VKYTKCHAQDSAIIIYITFTNTYRGESVMRIAVFLLAAVMVFPPLTMSEISTSHGSRAVLEIPLSFPYPRMSTVDGYLLYTVEGCRMLYGQEGKPVLPYWHHMVSLPLNSRVHRVYLRDAELDAWHVNGLVLPSIPPVPTNAAEVPEPVPGEVYQRDAYFPDERVYYTVTTGRGDRGDIEAHVSVDVFPLRYNPAAGEVVEVTSATLVIEYTPGSGMPGSRDGEEYDILIIAPSGYVSEMRRYQKDKSSLGFTSKIVTLDDIYRGRYFNETAGRDNPERIKYFIRDALENWSIEFVVLVGDVERIPVRYAHVEDGADGTNTPSDLYYGDIYKSGTTEFSDWDYDRDDVFGESSYGNANADHVDLDPDVSVGRLPVSSLTQLRGVVNKITAYDENVSKPSAVSWFSNATFVGSDTFSSEPSGVAEGEYALNVAGSYLKYFNISKFYETTGTFSTAAIRNSLNRGAGIMAFSDHGSTSGVVYPSSGGGPGLSSSTASSLTNGHMLGLSIMDACLTHRIDSNDSLGERIVLNPNGGAIASMGATRIGFGLWGASHILGNSGYMLVHIIQTFSKGTILPGLILDKTKRQYISNVHLNDYADFKTLVEYITLGDPVTFLGGKRVLEVMPGETEKSALPGGAVTYTVQVRNAALHGDTVSVNVTGGRWHYSYLEGDIGIGARNYTNITVTVTVDTKALAGEQDVAQLVLTPYSTLRPITVNLTTTAEAVRNFGMDLNSSSYEAMPGDNVSVEYSLINHGNIEETATMSCGLPDGWSAEDVEVTVAPYTVSHHVFSVHVPEDALAGTYVLTLHMETDSGFNGSRIFRVTVGETYGFTVSPAGISTAASNMYANFSFSIQSLANHEVVYDISARDLPPNWGDYLPSTVKVDAFSTEQVEGTVLTDQYTLAGNYSFTVVVSGPENTASVVVNVEVPQVSSVVVQCFEDSAEVMPGDSLEFSLDVTAGSNFQENLELNVSGLPEGWEATYGAEVVVDPFSSLTVPVELTVPGNCTAGVYSITYTLGNETGTFTVTVLPVPGMELSADRDHMEMYFRDGEQTAVLTLSNTGNCEDTYQLVLDTPLDVELENTTVTLGPYSSTTITLTVPADQKVPEGTYTVEVRARSTGYGDAKTVKVRVKLIHVHDVDIVAPSDVAVKQGGMGSVTITVYNNGTATERVAIRPADAPPWGFQNTEVRVAPGEVKNITLNFTVPAEAPGKVYRASFTVEYMKQSTPVNCSITVSEIPHREVTTGGMGWGIWMGLAVVVAVVCGVVLWYTRKKLMLW